MALPEVDEIFDVAVIGGGVMGSASAFYAAAASARTILFEQFDSLHKRGSSHGASRIIRKSYPDAAYAELMCLAYPLWQDICRESGLRLIETTGGIDIVLRGSEGYTALTTACTKTGIPFRELSPADVEMQYGITIPPAAVALWQADTGVISATTTVAAFQQLAVKRGATIRDRTTIQSITPAHSDASSLSTLVTTDGRSFRARSVVLAPGAWAGPLLERLLQIRLPLQVLQCTTAYFGCRDERSTERLSSLPVVINYGNAQTNWSTGAPSHAPTESDVDAVLVYGCGREYPGLIKFGVHTGVPTTADARSFEPAIAQTLEPVQRWIAARVPFLDSSRYSMAETCLYTMTPDENFIVDVCAAAPGNQRIVIAAGFSGQ